MSLAVAPNLPDTVAGQVLRHVIEGAATLAAHGIRVSAAGVVSVIEHDHGPAVAEIVHRHLVEAGAFAEARQ